MPNVVEQCNCGSVHVRWEDDSGLIAHGNNLRCMRCGNTLRRRGGFPWAFMLLAVAAAVWGWAAVLR